MLEGARTLAEHDHPAIAVLARYFDTVDRELRSSLAHGPLRELQRLQELADSPMPLSRDGELRYRLLHEDERTAVVEVKGEREVRYPARYGSADRSIIDHNGPATLERIDGHWRVIDYTVDGVRQLQAFTPVELPAAEVEGVRASIVGRYDVPQGSMVYVRLQLGESGLVVREGWLLHGRRWKAAWVAWGRTFVPREDAVLTVSSSLGQRSPRRLVLILDDDDRGRSLHVEPPLEPEAQPATPARLPWSLRLVRASALRLVVFLGVPFLFWPFGGAHGTAVVLAVWSVFGTWSLVRAKRGLVRVPRKAFLAPCLALPLAILLWFI